MSILYTVKPVETLDDKERAEIYWLARSSAENVWPDRNVDEHNEFAGLVADIGVDYNDRRIPRPRKRKVSDGFSITAEQDYGFDVPHYYMARLDIGRTALGVRNETSETVDKVFKKRLERLGRKEYSPDVYSHLGFAAMSAAPSDVRGRMSLNTKQVNIMDVMVVLAGIAGNIPPDSPISASVLADDSAWAEELSSLGFRCPRDEAREEVSIFGPDKRPAVHEVWLADRMDLVQGRILAKSFGDYALSQVNQSVSELSIEGVMYARTNFIF